MGWPQPQWLAAGAVAVALALAAWGVLILRHLTGARGMPGVVSHGWVALASLAVLLASALSLAGTWLGLPVPSREITLGLHLVFAPYGFMGLLALGLSYILVPMFALARVAGRALTTGFLRAGRGGAGAGRTGGVRLGTGGAAPCRLAGRGAGRGAAPGADGQGLAHRHAPRTRPFVPAGEDRLGRPGRQPAAGAGAGAGTAGCRAWPDGSRCPWSASGS